MRENILDHAEMIVQDKGLGAVSFQQLADAVSLSKASVFHHFRNRDALALGLIERCRNKYGMEYSTIAAKKSPAPNKLREIVDSFDQGLRNNRLCLLAALGNSHKTLPEELQAELNETANAATRAFGRIFEQGAQEGSLHFNGSHTTAAQTFLALLQGLQQLARCSNNLDILKDSAASYITTLEASLSPAGL